MFSSGAWSNARNLLSEKNIEVVIAAIELMANLSLSEAVSRYT
jgi:hypothetical protein